MVNEGLASLVFPLFLPLIAYVGLRGAKEMVPELSDGLRLTAFIAAPMICSFCVRSTTLQLVSMKCSQRARFLCGFSILLLKMVAGQNVEEIKVSVWQILSPFSNRNSTFPRKGSIPKCNFHEVPFRG